MTNLLRRSALVICLLAVAAQANAAVALLSQSRSVSGSLGAFAGSCDAGWFWFDDGTISAPDYGPFEENVSVDAGGVYPLSSVTTTQNSEIQTDHFSIHGSAAASVVIGGTIVHERVPGVVGMDVGAGCSVGSVTGDSDFEVLFEVSTPTSFSLAGSLASTLAFLGGGGDSLSCCPPDGGSTVAASLQLDRDGAPYLSFYLDNDNSQIAVSEGGILEPGTYSLTVNGSAGAWVANQIGEANAFSSFDFDFFLGTSVSVEEWSWGRVKAAFR